MKEMKFTRASRVLSALLLSLSLVAAGPAQMLVRAQEGDNYPVTSFPDYDQREKQLVKQAVTRWVQKKADEERQRAVAVIVPHILKVQKDADQVKFVAYVAYGAFYRQEDGRYRNNMWMVAPFEFYAATNPATGETEVYASAVFAPRKVDESVWVSSGIMEETYDPQLPLKQELRGNASPQVRDRALAFLEADPDFPESVWDDIIGKPLEQAAPQEVSEAFRLFKTRDKAAYDLGVEQYMRLSGRVLYDEHNFQGFK